MLVDVPMYPGLQGVVGENARPGHFFVVSPGLNLSRIANQAYGVGTLQYALRINKSAWNRGNCAYRRSSSNCNSTRVSSDLALTQNHFGDGAWLSLCPRDTQEWAANLGAVLPVIWVPGPNGEEPEDYVGEPDGFTPEVPIDIPGETPVPDDDPLGPSAPEGFVEGDPTPAPRRSNWGWIVGVASIGMAIGIAGLVTRGGKQ